MDALFGFLKVVAICITALVALFLVLLVIPRSPVRDIAVALTKRLGATALGAGMFLPIDVIPVLGELGDIAILIFTAWYWYTFFRDIRRSVAQSSPPPLPVGGPQIIDVKRVDPGDQGPYRR